MTLNKVIAEPSISTVLSSLPVRKSKLEVLIMATNALVFSENLGNLRDKVNFVLFKESLTV